MRRENRRSNLSSFKATTPPLPCDGQAVFDRQVYIGCDMGRADPHGSGWVGLRAGLGWRFGQPEPARVGLRYFTTQPARVLPRTRGLVLNIVYDIIKS